MSTEFGPDWLKMFSSFDRVPVASASIGQVHRATIASTGLPVAVKIQFPGIASSINSDLSNLSILLRSSALLPKGLYLQNTIAVMKRELEDECDYIREAEAGRRFARLLEGYDFFRVPKVVDEASSSKVLTVEWMEGKPLSKIKGLSQQARDQVIYLHTICLDSPMADSPDRRERTPPLPLGAVRIPLHADGPQLGEFSVRHQGVKTWLDRFRRIEGIHQRVHGRVVPAPDQCTQGRQDGHEGRKRESGLSHW